MFIQGCAVCLCLGCPSSSRGSPGRWQSPGLAASQGVSRCLPSWGGGGPVLVSQYLCSWVGTWLLWWKTCGFGFMLHSYCFTLPADE